MESPKQRQEAPPSAEQALFDHFRLQPPHPPALRPRCPRSPRKAGEQLPVARQRPEQLQRADDPPLHVRDTQGQQRGLPAAPRAAAHVSVRPLPRLPQQPIGGQGECAGERGEPQSAVPPILPQPGLFAVFDHLCF